MPIRTQNFDSRQSMNGKTFEIFHYREAKPEAVSVHHHDFYEIYFFLGGEVSYWAEGKIYQLQPGDLLLMSPMQFHHPIVQPGAVYERMVLWIDRNYLSAISTTDVDLTTCFHSNTDGNANLLHPTVLMRRKIHELLEMLNRETHGQEFGQSLYAKSLLLQLLLEINRMASREDKTTVSSEPFDLVSQIASFINQHCHEEISLERLAKEFFVSKYYLSHEFSKQTGVSIYRYVILKRLMNAKELITVGQMPGEVYKYCGFHNYTNFYRAFKAEYGISPREFAEQVK